MGKQGPCCHCGVTSTPLWRNGPPEKPVLCNACGSRWRTKGSLVNYTPLHSRIDPDEYEEHRLARAKTISLKRKDEKSNKRKLSYDHTIDGEYTPPDYSQGFRKSLDEDASNRSSSGSAVSNSESCAQFGNADASDLTGPAQSMVWDALVPSRKRTCVTRAKQSSVEKLTKDLHSILHEQASHFSGTSEEDLLFESEAPMGSVEFGHGCVLIRPPSSIAREEESEASSLSVDNKLCKVDEGFATPASLVSLSNSKSAYNSCSGGGKVKKLSGQIAQFEQVKRDKSSHEKLQILLSNNSPLCQIDLTKIVNSNVFWGRLSADEQKDLLNYLPSEDTSALPEGLESMFASPCFMESLSSFQQLLSEGVLDSSFLGVKAEECKILKKLVISDQTKCKWVEHYNKMKDKMAKESGCQEYFNLSGAKSSTSGNVGIAKKSRENQSRFCPEVKTKLKIPKRGLSKAMCERKEPKQNEGSSFLIPTPHNIFGLQANGSSLMLDSFQLEEDSSDQDLLLDVPSNGLLPEAELLHPVPRFASQQASASSSSTYPALVHP